MEHPVEPAHETPHAEDRVGGAETAIGGAVAAPVPLVRARPGHDRAIEIQAVVAVTLARLGDAVGQPVGPDAVVADFEIALFGMAIPAGGNLAGGILHQYFVVQLGPLRCQRRELIAVIDEHFHPALVAGVDDGLELRLGGRHRVVLDRRPIFVEYGGLDAQLCGAVERDGRIAVGERAVAEPPLLGNRQRGADAQLRHVPDPPLVKILGPRLHRGCLEAKCERDGQPHGRVEQTHAKQDNVFFHDDLDRAIGRVWLPALVRLGKPAQSSVLLAQPDERLEGENETRFGQLAAILRAAPAAREIVEEAGALPFQRHLEPQLLELGRHLVLRQHDRVDAHHAIEFDPGSRVDDQIVARLPAGDYRLR